MSGNEVVGGDARAIAPPRPAVARIVVQEQGATAFGSGALVDVKGEYGLVVTNWHVVRDATGPIEVVFPSGFRSQARRLKLDEDWDLAALVVWRPPVDPLPLASRAPRPGDRLTICGYGSGAYREATGRCTDYYAPNDRLPQELVELDVEARQGDSGGPIFNDRGEIAGVLFGAGQGTTLGSYGGRVGAFLASLTPSLGPPSPRAPLSPDSLQSFPHGARQEPALVAATPPQPNPSASSTSSWPQDLAPLPAIAASQPTVADQPNPANVAAPSAGHDRYAAPRAIGAELEQPPATEPVVASLATTETAPLAPDWFDEAKSIFAVVGIVFLLLQLIRIVT